MSSPSVADAVRADVVVAVPPERAFEVFVERHDSWWPREYHIGPADVDRVVIEPREGGRWFEGGDGRPRVRVGTGPGVRAAEAAGARLADLGPVVV